MNIRELTLSQKIIIALLIVAVVGLCASAIFNSTSKEETATVYDVDAVELYNHYAEYQGEYVRFAALYETIIPEHNAITFSEGLNDYRKCIYAWMQEGQLPNQSEDFSGQYVLITGKVKDRAVGILNISDCRLEAIGEDAYEFYKAHRNIQGDF